MPGSLPGSALALPVFGSLLSSPYELNKTLDRSKVAKHRSHRTELQVYLKMYYHTKLRDTVTTAMDGKDRGERLKVQVEVARSAYEKETEEVKDKVRARVQELREGDANLANYDDDDEMGALEDNELLKAYVFFISIGSAMFTYLSFRRIAALPAYLEFYLEQLHRLTGFRFTVYGGGRDSDGISTMFTYVTHLSFVHTCVNTIPLIAFMEASAMAPSPQHSAALWARNSMKRSRHDSMSTLTTPEVSHQINHKPSSV